MPWFIYVIRTVDNNLYTGVTIDVQRRFEEHASQGRKSAKYLRAHKPSKVVFSKKIGEKRVALKVEYHFKKLSKLQKEEVVNHKKLLYDNVTGEIVRVKSKCQKKVC